MRLVSYDTLVLLCRNKRGNLQFSDHEAARGGVQLIPSCRWAITSSATRKGSFRNKNRGTLEPFTTCLSLQVIQWMILFSRIVIKAIKSFVRGLPQQIQRAFKIIPGHPFQWHLLGINWEGKSHFDEVLSIGGRSSLFIFDNVSAAIEWICVTKYILEYLMHLLGDFLCVKPPDRTPTALGLLRKIFQLSREAADKLWELSPSYILRWKVRSSHLYSQAITS